MTPEQGNLPPGWSKVLDQIEENYIDGHKRLRTDLEALRGTVESNFRHFDDQARLVRAEAAAAQTAASKPVDAMNLMMSTRAIVSMIFGVLVLAGSYWNLSNKLDTQQRTFENTAKLQEIQMKALSDIATDAKATAAAASRQYELLRYEFQSLKETVLGKDKKP